LTYRSGGVESIDQIGQGIQPLLWYSLAQLSTNMEAGESMSLQKRVEQTSGVVSKCEGGDLSPRRRQGKVSESAASVVDAGERR